MNNRWNASLIIGFVTMAIPLIAQAPSDTAQALVKAIADPTYSSVAVLKRFNDTPTDATKEVIGAWTEALSHVTGQKLDDPLNQIKLAMMPAKFVELYAQGSFQANRAKEYGTCIRQISGASIGEWVTGLEAASGSGGDRVSVALQIVRFPGVCAAGQLNQQLVGAFHERLASLQKDAVVAWAGAQGTGNMDNGSAALNLIGVEQLFVANKFQIERFRAALPLASASLEQARSKK